MRSTKVQFNPQPATIPAEGYVRLSQILKVIPIGKSAWWAGVAEGRYPSPVRHHPFGRITVWRAADIRAMLDQGDINISTLSSENAR